MIRKPARNEAFERAWIAPDIATPKTFKTTNIQTLYDAFVPYH